MQKIKWTEEKMKRMIYEIMDFLHIDRLPTFEEMRQYTRDESLTNKVSKYGGVVKLSEEMGIPVKRSETGLAYIFESGALKMLEEHGFEGCLTPTRYPYDILVNGRVKIDVKVGSTCKLNGSDAYTFNLAKKMQTCDIYMAFCIDGDREEVQKLYIIPSHVMTGKSQLSVGVKSSKYDVYLDRFDLISMYDEAIKSTAV